MQMTFYNSRSIIILVLISFFSIHQTIKIQALILNYSPQTAYCGAFLATTLLTAAAYKEFVDQSSIKQQEHTKQILLNKTEHAFPTPNQTFAQFLKTVLIYANNPKKQYQVIKKLFALKNKIKSFSTNETELLPYPKLMLLTMVTQAMLINAGYQFFFKPTLPVPESSRLQEANNNQKKVVTHDIGTLTESKALTTQGADPETILQPPIKIDQHPSDRTETTQTTPRQEPTPKVTRTVTTETEPEVLSTPKKRQNTPESQSTLEGESETDEDSIISNISSEEEKQEPIAQNDPTLVNELTQATLEKIVFTGSESSFNYIWLFKTPKERVFHFEYLMKKKLHCIPTPDRQQEIIQALEKTTVRKKEEGLLGHRDETNKTPRTEKKSLPKGSPIPVPARNLMTKGYSTPRSFCKSHCIGIHKNKPRVDQTNLNQSPGNRQTRRALFFH